LRLSLYRFDAGVDTGDGECVVYDLERGAAAFGAASVVGPALVWQLEHEGAEGVDAVLSRAVEVDPSTEWVLRCDRVDFPPGGIAHRHVHPGPGIRYLLRGEITIETDGVATVYGAGGAWFESGPAPVVARASAHEETSFARVLLLPGEWAGKRTITYLDPVPESTPRQSAAVLLERPITLPS
jgi:quercetin dioxygenase-like cupin family protein